MGRMTNRTSYGTAYVRSETGQEGVGHFTTQRRLPDIISKLAAYEDTGLTPDEINSLCDEVDRLSVRWTPLTPYTFPEVGKNVEVLLDNGCTCVAYCREADREWFSGSLLVIRKVRYWREWQIK